MNCKPGDMAVQIAGNRNVGCFFDVQSSCDCHPAAWQMTTKQPCVHALMFMGYMPGIYACPAGEKVCEFDRNLKPIRPQAPLLALPTPAKELEHTP